MTDTEKRIQLLERRIEGKRIEAQNALHELDLLCKEVLSLKMKTEDNVGEDRDKQS